MKPKSAAIINYYELSEAWQDEARSNLDEFAEEAKYLEPDENHNPKEHVLWDLNECMAQSGDHEGFKYNGVIGISNNSAMLLNVSDCGEECNFIIV